MQSRKVLPCPFCSKGFRINCSGAYEHDSDDCLLHGFEICNEKQLEKWNTRKPIEQAIKQLEKQQEDLETDMWARENDNWYGQYCNGRSEGIDDAIDILRNGVVKDE